MNEIYEFLKEAGTYFLATTENGEPRVRPFGTIHLFEDHLYIQTGKIKPVARQMKENPVIEICAFHNGTWARVRAKAVLDERIEAQQSMLDAYPSLQGMYKAGDGNTEVYRLEDVYATLESFTAPKKEFRF